MPSTEGRIFSLSNKGICSFLSSFVIRTLIIIPCRSQWPSGPKRGFAAARLLGLWFESHRGNGYLSVVSVVCYQIEISASGWSLVQNSPTMCGVSVCDHEFSIMRKPWPTGGVAPWY